MDNVELVGHHVVIRIVKPYPHARNHIYTGRVLAYDGKLITIDGCVLHYGKASVDDPTGGLTTSSRAIRWVALQRVEYIRELPEGADPYDPGGINVTTDGSLEIHVADRPDLLPE